MDSYANQTAAGRRPTVHLLCGLNGAGKTTLARELQTALPAVRFSLDEWMLRLYPGVHFAAAEYGDLAVERVWRRAAEGDPWSHRLDEGGVRHLAGIFEPPGPEEGPEIRSVSGR